MGSHHEGRGGRGCGAGALVVGVVPYDKGHRGCVASVEGGAVVQCS